LPEDGRVHALPPSLGKFPLKRIEDYKEKVPAAWREHGGVFFPMWQREAMWLAFVAPRQPFALKVAAGKVNAVNGDIWDGRGELRVKGSGMDASGNTRPSSQNYMVSPPQPWLDGFNTGNSRIRQFVAMPLGMGYTVEGQVTGKEDVGGIQIMAIPPKDGRLEPVQRSVMRSAGMKSGGYKGGMSVGGYQGGGTYASNNSESGLSFMCMDSAPVTKSAEMGLAQGGEMKQKIYPDPHGPDTWDHDRMGRIFIHIVNSELYEQITGEKAPPSPITARDYTRAGFKWYEIWDEEMGDVKASSTLSGVKTVAQVDKQHGFEGQQDDSPTGEKKVVSTGKIPPTPTIKEGTEW
jgi:hypothetical protein